MRFVLLALFYGYSVQYIIEFNNLVVYDGCSCKFIVFFCRFAIDTMQSVCLDEFGGEKNVDPRSQETTIIQHIFGGQLQSQVMHLLVK